MGLGGLTWDTLGNPLAPIERVKKEDQNVPVFFARTRDESLESIISVQASRMTIKGRKGGWIKCPRGIVGVYRVS